MNWINNAVTGLFDLLLKPLGFLGPELTLVLVSGIFGILALIAFKFISAQRAIKATKDKIKAGLIEIRLYSYDLGVVSRAVVRVLLQNVKYLFLNFGPILPLFIPFAFIAAQLVCRFGFAPLPIYEQGHRELLAGGGTVLSVELRPGSEALVEGLQIQLPETLRGTQPLMRNKSAGRAWIEFVPAAEGQAQLTFSLADGSTVTKAVASGPKAPPGLLSPERVGPWYEAVLYPAEDSLAGTPFQKIAFVYPNRELRWLPDGPVGVLATFLVASMLFGVLVLKPLKIQI